MQKIIDIWASAEQLTEVAEMLLGQKFVVHVMDVDNGRERFYLCTVAELEDYVASMDGVTTEVLEKATLVAEERIPNDEMYNVRTFLVAEILNRVK